MLCVLGVLSHRQIVELFHLHFVRLLCAGADKDRFGIKGGCNLRFFFESVRYSEDIDFDVHTIARESLQKNVNQILSAPGFSRILRSSKIELGQISEPKQTDTTQRWKVHARVDGSPADLPTKIEFSRRKTTEEAPQLGRSHVSTLLPSSARARAISGTPPTSFVNRPPGVITHGCPSPTTS